MTAWSGLALLAFNLIAGALLPANAASPANQMAQQAYICTALGRTAIGPDGKAEPGQTGHGVELCIYCLPLLQGSVDGPASALALQPPLAVAMADPALPGTVTVSPQTRHNSAAPRAPPVL
jgi:hypothetical protein